MAKTSNSKTNIFTRIFSKKDKTEKTESSSSSKSGGGSTQVYTKLGGGGLQSTTPELELNAATSYVAPPSQKQSSSMIYAASDLPQLKYLQSQFSSGNLGKVSSDSYNQKGGTKVDYGRAEYDLGVKNGTRKAFAGIDHLTGKELYTDVLVGQTTVAEEERFRDAERAVNLYSYEKKLNDYVNKDVTDIITNQTKKYQNLIDVGALTLEQAKELMEQDIKNQINNLGTQEKYIELENQLTNKLREIKTSPEFIDTISQDYRTKKQKILDSTPVVGSIRYLKESLKELEYAQRKQKIADVFMDITPQTSETKKEVLRELSKESALKAGKVISGLGFVAMDISFITGLAKAGVSLSRNAIQKELAKRSSITIDELSKSRIKGLNVIEKNGKFYLRGVQEVKGAKRVFELEGKIIFTKDGVAFIPSSKGASVVVGLTKADLTGITGKTKKFISKLIDEPVTQLSTDFSLFDVSSRSASKELSIPFKGKPTSLGSGLGVFTERASTYATATRKTSTKSIIEQFRKNMLIRESAVTSPTRGGSISGLNLKGIPASIDVSKTGTFLNLFKSKPTRKVIDIGKRETPLFFRDTRKINLKPLKRDSSLFSTKKVTSLNIKPELKSNGGTILKLDTKKIKNLPEITNILEEGFKKSVRPKVKPFTFAKTTSELSKKATTSLFGLITSQVARKGLTMESKKSILSSKFSPSLSSNLFLSQKFSSSLIQKKKPINLITSPNLITPSSFRELGGFSPSLIGSKGLGEIETGGGKRKPSKKTKRKGKTIYAPSLASVLLGKKKVKVTKQQLIELGKKSYFGFELRPEVELV